MKIRMWLLCVLIAPTLVILRPPPAQAEFYKYIDKDGKSNFVDDLTKIPEEYRSNYEVYPEKYDELPAKERSSLLEIERQRVLELEDAGRRQLEEQIQLMEELEAAEKARREQEASAGLETPITVEGNQILVPVTLVNAGRQVKSTFLLDTGASHIVVFRKLADQLQIAAMQKGHSQIAGGQQIYSEFGRIEVFKVGPIEMPNSDVLIIAYDGPGVRFDGLLGMNFLGNLEYSIDIKNKVIRWKPQVNP